MPSTGDESIFLVITEHKWSEKDLYNEIKRQLPSILHDLNLQEMFGTTSSGAKQGTPTTLTSTPETDTTEPFNFQSELGKALEVVDTLTNILTRLSEHLRLNSKAVPDGVNGLNVPAHFDSEQQNSVLNPVTGGDETHHPVLLDGEIWCSHLHCEFNDDKLFNKKTGKIEIPIKIYDWDEIQEALQEVIPGVPDTTVSEIINVFLSTGKLAE